jgi:hypothetical protein
MATLGCLVPAGGGFSALAARLAADAGPVFQADAHCAAPPNASESRHRERRSGERSGERSGGSERSGGERGGGGGSPSTVHVGAAPSAPSAHVSAPAIARMFGLRLGAAALNGGLAEVLSNQTVVDAGGVDTGRVRVRVREPRSQAGSVWLLKPSNLRWV